MALDRSNKAVGAAVMVLSLLLAMNAYALCYDTVTSGTASCTESGVQGFVDDADDNDLDSFRVWSGNGGGSGPGAVGCQAFATDTHGQVVYGDPTFGSTVVDELRTYCPIVQYGVRCWTNTKDPDDGV